MKPGDEIYQKVIRPIKQKTLYVAPKSRDGWRRGREIRCSEMCGAPKGLPYGDIYQDFNWLGGDISPFITFIETSLDACGQKHYQTRGGDTWGPVRGDPNVNWMAK